MLGVLILFLYAAVSDFNGLRIPNWLPLAAALAFLPAGLLAGLGWDSLLIRHYSMAPPALAVGLFVFWRGWLGGGDVKLLVAVSVWTGWQTFPAYLITTAILGGALALFALFVLHPPGSMLLRWVPMLKKGFAKGDKIPYGIAISAGVLPIIPQLDTLPPTWAAVLF